MITKNIKEAANSKIPLDQEIPLDLEIPLDDPEIALDPDQQEAFDSILNNENVFVTGKAGVGKSFLISQIKKRLVHKRIALCAFSGLAARNIDGMTIHGTFGFAIGPLENNYYPTDEKVMAYIRKIDVLFIDEISTVKSDLFNAINNTMQVAMKNNKPFGGKQLCIFGDLHQLPSFASSTLEYEMLQNDYGGELPFLTKAWQEANFNVISLNTIHRQKGDLQLIEMLNTIRNGDIYAPKFYYRDFYEGEMNLNCIDFINTICHISKEPKFEDSITLCMTNDVADRINEKKLEEIDAPKYTFIGYKRGEFPNKDLPSPKVLELKVGCQIIITANSIYYVNGQRGKVLYIDPNQEYILVQLESGEKVFVNNNRWNNQGYWWYEDFEGDLETELKRKVIGTFDQFPLKLAYGLSTHKSQGMTLPKVHLDLTSSPFCFGQLYVALSRCQTFHNLSISREIRPEDVMQDARVFEYYNYIARTQNRRM